MEYKGYFGSIEISVEDEVLYGKILFVNDLITYESENPKELKAAFEEAVDDYLDYCNQCGKEPEKPFRGVFNVRITPELHRQAAHKALKMGVTLNQFVANAIKKYCSEEKERNQVVHITIENKGSIEPLVTIDKSMFNSAMSFIKERKYGN